MSARKMITITEGRTMKRMISLSLAVTVLVSQGAQGQLPSWDAAQRAVWAFVEQSWVDDAAENGRWPTEYVHDKVVDWGDSQPAPRGIERLTEWTRFEDQGNETLYYEITPAAIVVEDNTAVVHYHLITVTENHAGERETSVLGLIETLIRQNGAWRYISLSAFEPKFNQG